MKIQSDPDLHLTYCLNIHPGETLPDVASAITDYAARVKAVFAPNDPFGLGIRLSADAAGSLSGKELSEFRDLIHAQGMYVFTINGFPYSNFHGTRVKENVYAPDWMTSERREYTRNLVAILGELLPEGVEGSISTVPVSYWPWIKTESDIERAINQLVLAALSCLRLEQESGKKVSIALEPEPDCYLQKMDGTVSFFNDHLLQKGAPLLAKETGMSDADCEAAIRRYLGVCFDTCHSAVQFEDPVDALGLLAMEGIAVPKIQMSSAIHAVVTDASKEQLKRFIDPVYFHQARVKDGKGNVVFYPDLDEQMLGMLDEGCELRTHFHVPLWFESEGALQGTVSGLPSEFFRMINDGASPHVEAETYTFDVLPEGLRQMEATESVIKELEWVKARLELASR